MNNKTDYKTLIQENFGELNARQLWALVRLSKNVRMRCRNNAAFNNFFGATFPYATFKTVNKTRISWKTNLPETYPGLQITVKDEVAGGDEAEE